MRWRDKFSCVSLKLSIFMQSKVISRMVVLQAKRISHCFLFMGQVGERSWTFTVEKRRSDNENKC